MIRTRFGKPVAKVLCGNIDTSHVDIEMEDGTRHETYVWELRADGGITEIVNAIAEANTANEQHR